MAEPKRVQRKRTKGWRMPEGAVYVGRPSKWGNPFRVAIEPVRYSLRGPGLDGRPEWEGIERELALAYLPGTYRRWLCVGPGRALLPSVPELIGRDLVCWCPIGGDWCHADELLALARFRG